MTVQTASPPSPAATSTGAATTLTQLFEERAARSADRVALRRKIGGAWEDVSWRGYRDAARRIGRGLLKLGLERGQSVAILSQTRAEWAFCDLAILLAGGVTVPVYQSSTPEDVQFILQDARVRHVFVEDLDQWRKLRPMLPELKDVEKLVLFDTSPTARTKPQDAPFEGDARVITLDALCELGEAQDGAALEARARAVTASDVVTLIYTSGTTGRPKGVVLTHGNAVAECEAVADALGVAEDDLTLAFLPLAHVFARVMHWMQLRAGYACAFAESMTKVIDNVGEVRPTFLAGVPRIYEKIHAGTMAKVNANSAAMRRYALWGLEAAMLRDRLTREGKPVPLGLKLRTAAGAPAVSKLRRGLLERTGGRIKFMISGGAPLSPEIACFFHTLGFVIYEGYGLTETTAATHLNRPGAYRLGWVGQVVKGVEHKIAPDGEVLLKGAVIMRGYHNRADATAEVLKDGWFYTGDIGEIDASGFLRITDRKKDLIITAAGKNISPQNVENHLKTGRFVSQAALFGDKKKFCVALLTLNEDEVRKALAAEGVQAPATSEELAAHPRVRALLEALVAEKNKELASYESVKYFELLPRDFEVGRELTPTLKVRRKEVTKLYGHLVEQMYARAEKGGGGGGE